MAAAHQLFCNACSDSTCPRATQAPPTQARARTLAIAAGLRPARLGDAQASAMRLCTACVVHSVLAAQHSIKQRL